MSKDGSTKLKSKKEVHLVIQGKGGVGKTLVSSLLAQFYTSQNRNVICIDTDPVNQSFKDIEKLNVKTVHLFKENQNHIDYNSLDKMLSEIVENPATYIIDNGAASFQPMMTYFITDGAIEILLENDYIVVLHLIIATGQELAMTMTGTENIISSMNSEDMLSTILWLNEKNGSFTDYDDNEFEDSPFYQEISNKINGLIYLQQMPEAQEIVFKEMLKNKLTFEEAQQSDDFLLVQKSRLKKIQKSIFEQIDNAIIGI
ncbi:nucleotide-binding protein [Commensalibacter nepenthis]|uniref:ArsA-related P-loop ATPase n=1 Tax=Commensalibacter nepenthis TaxID=3043872 RepID=A0ABT6QAE0_9PROT|nr:ArsA-related P-loop ATPase [Commensalibacter sp. TBRC 10068]MDI2113869.1 ArsA-related P-loop ATPase [Commensalibacter sp. TBRC 10068]